MEKHNIRFYMSIYMKLLKQCFKSKMSYRADFIITNIGNLFINILDILSVWIIFKNFSSIGGWSYHEMLFMYAFMLIVKTPCEVFFLNNWSLRYYVYSGDFIKYCFRPLNLFFYYISEDFGIKQLGGLLTGIILLGYSWPQLQIPFTAANLCKLILGCITGSLVMTGMMVMAAATCFYILNSGYILLMTNKLVSYAKYPATIFSSIFRIVFCTIIPIAFVVYYPSLWLLTGDNISMLTLSSPFIAALFMYTGYRFWMKGAMQYNGTGS